MIYISVFVPGLCCFDYCSFVAWRVVREPDSSSSVFFFLKMALAIQDLLCLYTKFKNFCSSFVKNAIVDLIGIASIL